MRQRHIYKGITKQRLINALLNISSSIDYISVLISNSDYDKKKLPEDILVAKGWGDGLLGICNILKEHNLTDSTSAARRLIQQGSVTINGEKVSNVNQELRGNQEYLIKVGKKRFLKIQPG